MSESDTETIDVDLSEFGYKDIEFFDAIKTINENPDQFEHTEKSAVPANTTSIQEATQLNKAEVSYRLGGERANHAGYDLEEGMGLLQVHPAEPYQGQWAPKSAELTEKGIRVLNLVKEQRGLGVDGSASDDVPDELGEQIVEVEQAMSDLEAEVATLADQLEQLEDSDVGALGEKYARALESVVTGFPAHDHIFSEVFGLDTEAFKGGADEETVKEQRAQALDVLQDHA